MIPLRHVLASAFVVLLPSLVLSQASHPNKAADPWGHHRVVVGDEHSPDLGDTQRSWPPDFLHRRRGSAMRLPRGAAGELTSATSRSLQDLPLLWARYFASEDAASVDEVYAGAVDFSGNAYMTGSSTRLPFGSDYLTVKLGPAGNRLWAVRYSGQTEGENIAWAVTVDGLGNVYVTGQSPDPHCTDIATIKYNALGVQQWVARWGSELGLDDRGTALVVDPSGNVIVAGMTMGEDRNEDIVLLSYSGEGTERWVRHYDGPPTTTSYGWPAVQVVPDPFGGVFAAMTTAGEDSSEDLLCLCLDTNGEEVWRDLMTGPMGSDNECRAVAVDPSGALIVGGTGDGWGTGDDWFVLKYGGGGFREWTVRFDGPGNSAYDWLSDIAVDDSGNVYAYGGIGDYATYTALLCLDRYGNEKWVQYPPDLGFDSPRGVTVVPPGAIRLVGETYSGDPSIPNDVFVVQYDTVGTSDWTLTIVPQGATSTFVTDAGWEPAGASYVFASISTSAGRSNCGVLKVGPGGGLLYDSQYDGPGTSYDDARVGWVHPSGAISLGGSSLLGGDRTRARTVRFAPDGRQEWVQQYFSPADSLSFIAAMTGDRDGNTYVAGYTYEAASDFDIVTIKYTAGGAEAWKDRHIVSGDQIPAGIAVDDSGNVYVVGTGDPYTMGAQFQILKYSPLGARIWSLAQQAPQGTSCTAYDVEAAPGGGICFTGESFGATLGQAMVTERLNPDGSTAWLSFYTSPGGYRATPEAITVTDSGIVYVAGTVPAAAGGYDPFCARYGAQGSEDWTLTVASPGTWESFYDLLVAPEGSLFLLGRVYNDPMQADVLLMCLGVDGQEVWSRVYASPLGGDDRPISLSRDSLGFVYATLSCESPETMSQDCLTQKYDTDGNVVETAYYAGPGTSMERPCVSGIDLEGNLLVGGTELGARYNWSVMRAMKFSTSPTAVSPAWQERPVRFQLAQNYPNPFNPVTLMRLGVPERSRVHLSVYNILGQQVATVLDRVLEAGVHAVEFDAARLPSGVYFYTMRAGTFVASRKMVVLR